MFQVDEKKIITIGFIGAMFVEIIYLVSLFVNINSTFLSLFHIVAFCIVALGYFLRFINNRESIDFITTGAVGVNILINILWLTPIYFYSNFMQIFTCVLSSTYFLILAIRAKKYNPLLVLLLVCAFAYFSFSNLVVDLLFEINLPYMVILVCWYLGHILCAGLCVIESSYE